MREKSYDSGVISRTYKELRKLSTHKTNNSINKQESELDRQCSKEVQMGYTFMKKHQHLSYQINANSNCTEIPSYHSQNGYHQN